MRKTVLVESLDEKERQTAIDFEDLMLGIITECTQNDFISITAGADSVVYNLDDLYMVKNFLFNVLNDHSIVFNKRKVVMEDADTK